MDRIRELKDVLAGGASTAPPAAPDRTAQAGGSTGGGHASAPVLGDPVASVTPDTACAPGAGDGEFAAQPVAAAAVAEVLFEAVDACVREVEGPASDGRDVLGVRDRLHSVAGGEHAGEPGTLACAEAGGAFSADGSGEKRPGIVRSSKVDGSDMSHAVSGLAGDGEAACSVAQQGTAAQGGAPQCTRPFEDNSECVAGISAASPPGIGLAAKDARLRAMRRGCSAAGATAAQQAAQPQLERPEPGCGSQRQRPQRTQQGSAGCGIEGAAVGAREPQCEGSPGEGSPNAELQCAGADGGCIACVAVDTAAGPEGRHAAGGGGGAGEPDAPEGWLAAAEAEAAGVYFMVNMHTDNVTLLEGDDGEAALGIKVPLRVLRPQPGGEMLDQAARLADALEARPLCCACTHTKHARALHARQIAVDCDLRRRARSWDASMPLAAQPVWCKGGGLRSHQ